MQVSLVSSVLETKSGAIANDILRRCVHCGFCNATCPTYQLTGDELDGPRGRIYLIKQVLEGHAPGVQTSFHLDRCLQCRACETTCPSGVKYSSLLHVGQRIVAQQSSRSLPDKIFRRLLNLVLVRPGLFNLLLQAGQIGKSFLPAGLARKIPGKQDFQPVTSVAGQQRHVILLDGCVQQCATPATNAATMRVLNYLGIETKHSPAVKCCAAIPAHLGTHHQAVTMIKQNIDSWWPMINDHTQAIISTASGCGLMISEYADYLADEPDYQEKAQQIKKLNMDLAEFIRGEDITGIVAKENTRVSYHPPCTQQHGLGITDLVESLLSRVGFTMAEVNDKHICCGSAGTYSITQPVLSRELLNNKISNLARTKADVIATANVGCQLHLQTATDIPVVHWIELLATGIDRETR